VIGCQRFSDQSYRCVVSTELSHSVTVWRFDVDISDIGEINWVALRRAWLVLGWLTAPENLSRSKQPPRLTQLGHPSVGRYNEYRQSAMTLCGWGVKAGMVRVWWQIQLRDPLYNTCHTWARLRLRAIQIHVYFSLLFNSSVHAEIWSSHRLIVAWAVDIITPSPHRER